MVSDDLAPVLLGLFSALTLALANTAVKRGGDILSTRAVTQLTSAALVLPAVAVVPLPDAATWQALALALPAHFFYQVCLVRALHRGDLSLVFPVMRGLAPLLTALGAWVALGEALSFVTILGLIAVTGAVLVFAAPARGTALSRHPDAGALLWAVATAVGIALYSVSDARGVRLAPRAESYIVWLFLLDWIGIVLVNLAMAPDRLKTALRHGWRYGAAAGSLSVLSFGAALYGMTLTEVARISALRESAVVFAALLGWLYLKERLGPRRTLAALALAGGLVLMQFGG